MPTLQVETREKASSAAVNRLRGEGKLPMALLSKDQTTKLIQADRTEVHTLITGITGLNIFDVAGAGETVKVIMKEVQRDPVSRKVIHMTLQQITDADVIRVFIPVRVEGVPVAVAKRSATLLAPVSQVEVKGKVNDLPSEIVVDASKLKQNDRIIISDLKQYSDIEFVTSQDAVLASTKQLRGMADLDDNAEGGEGEEAGDATETAGSE